MNDVTSCVNKNTTFKKQRQEHFAPWISSNLTLLIERKNVKYKKLKSIQITIK